MAGQKSVPGKSEKCDERSGKIPTESCAFEHQFSTLMAVCKVPMKTKDLGG